MPSSKLSLNDLNTASEDWLVRRLKIPERLARRIISLRPYQSPQDLKKVWGLDEETYRRILTLVGPTPLQAASRIDESQPTTAEQDGDFPQAAPAAEPQPPTAAVPRTEAAQRWSPQPRPGRAPRRVSWITVLLLGVILLVGAYFRFTGLNWDQNTHQHPDERFMTIVADRIKPTTLGAYFNTQVSTLNPFQNNAGYTYGMFPLFLTRMVAGWVNMTPYDKVVLVGRAMSGLFDLAVVLLLYLLGKKTFGRRVGLLAAALYAAAVLPIQLSHYFAVDSFSTVFVVAGFYFAYQALPILNPGEKLGWKNLVSFALFGLVTGLAMACKINTAVLFGVVVIAGAAYLVSIWNQKGDRYTALWLVPIGLFVAGITALITFRVFQPYAFMGPGFFGLELNPRWLEIMKEVTGQVAGNSDWPPNDHWTNRSTTYALSNMISWGLGLPLGIAAWSAWLYAAWRCFKGEWRSLLLPVTWVGGYFLWQNVQFWRYMRYFLPIYPLIILLAAWALITLLDRTRSSMESLRLLLRRKASLRQAWKPSLPGLFAGLAILIVVGGAYLYAFGFTRIYNRPLTRISASQWILQNIRGPLNVLVTSGQASRTYPISSPADLSFSAGDKFSSAFKPMQSGTAAQIDTTRVSLALADLRVKIYADAELKNLLAEGHLVVASGDPPQSLTVRLPEITLEAGKTYPLVYSLKSGGPVEASGMILRGNDDQAPRLSLDWRLASQQDSPSEGKLALSPTTDVQVNRLVFEKFQGSIVPAPATIQVNLTRDNGGKEVIASASLTQTIYGNDNPQSPVFSFNPVTLEANTTYYVHYQVVSGGPVIFEPQAYAIETTWDDALPLGIAPYNLLGGVYAPLNLELYEPDTPEKRERMLEILDKADYIVLASNRGYDAMPRLPLRYPLTLKYYQLLFDCSCTGDQMEAKGYQLTLPFQSQLGFELAATFRSNPSIGPFPVYDDAADESFTVYDHPKVMIFKKSASFSIAQVRAQLEQVDLTQVINQSPLAVSRNPTGYRMPADRLSAQQAGGTWSAMFNPLAIVNSSQPVGAGVWYLTLFLLGLLFFPAVFLVFRGLPDRGYPLARLLALLATAWVAWMLGSLKVAPFTRWTILLVVLVFGAGNMFLAMKYWEEISEFLRRRWRYLLAVEGLFAVLFLFNLALRLGNPDLWQPWMGGEKPMNFAIFNSVLKAVNFPPTNAWFAGYYLNYYYYGYVLASIPTKILGILPSIAFNLILPTWFAMTGLGIFCVAYNLVAGLLPAIPGKTPAVDPEKTRRRIQRSAWAAGLAAVVMMLFLGNLYQVRQLWKFLPTVTNADQNANLTGIDRLGAVITGAGKVISGEAPLPGSKNRWYFDPSRPILNGVNNGKDTPIAEFPYFTFLYGDMHPHLLVMPVLFAALAWMLACLLAGKRRNIIEQILFWFAAGLILGVFRPAHTWDYPTFLGLSMLTVAWVQWREEPRINRAAVLSFLGKMVLLVGLSLILYAPFGQWFVTAYGSVELWNGLRTPLGDYISVHGLFLFILVSYLLWLSSGWIQQVFNRWVKNPMGWLNFSSQTLIALGSGLLAYIVILQLWVYDLEVFILVLPLLAWIGLLLFRKGRPVLHQVLLALFAAGLGITLLVEIFVLKGDNGRQNMVFYFYIQVWAIFSMAAGVLLALLFTRWQAWPAGWRWSWALGLALFVFGALAYPVTATPERLADRWPNVANPPITLDGMAYMLGNTLPAGSAPDPANGAVYDDNGKLLDLAYDYSGIRYMQQNVTGTPTIVEGNNGEYRWTARYSIYTGLPTVAGWSWHVRQHNSLMDGAIVDRRIEAVKSFYNTPDLQAAVDFLKRYQVQYVIVGDLERGIYEAAGLAKFGQLVQQGKLAEFYQAGDSSHGVQIYRVLKSQ